MSSLPFHLWLRWDGEEVVSSIARMRDVVLASSITIGPSLWEKVDAADQDYTYVTKPVAAAAAMVL